MLHPEVNRVGLVVFDDPEWRNEYLALFIRACGPLRQAQRARIRTTSPVRLTIIPCVCPGVCSGDAHGRARRKSSSTTNGAGWKPPLCTKSCTTPTKSLSTYGSTDSSTSAGAYEARSLRPYASSLTAASSLTGPPGSTATAANSFSW